MAPYHVTIHIGLPLNDEADSFEATAVQVATTSGRFVAVNFLKFETGKSG